METRRRGETAGVHAEAGLRPRTGPCTPRSSCKGSREGEATSRLPGESLQRRQYLLSGNARGAAPNCALPAPPPAGSARLPAQGVLGWEESRPAWRGLSARRLCSCPFLGASQINLEKNLQAGKGQSPPKS